MKRRVFLLSTSSMLAAPALHAQQAPIKILVGASAGGSTDTLARALASELGQRLGRTVIVENRPGAGGNIAADAVAKAAPDGNTLLMSYTSHAINATLYPTLPFDPVKDFTPLTCVAKAPSILVANPKLPVNNLRELIAYAKAHPAQLNFAIGGLGSSLHLASDAFKMESGTYIVDIPYKGTAPAIQDVLAGQVQLMFAPMVSGQVQVKAGRLKPLGVTSAKRLPQFPEVPAIAEVLPGYEMTAWFGLFGPGHMSPELTRRISDAARQAIASPEVHKRLETDGAMPVGNSPEEFGKFVRSEIVRLGKVVKFSGAKLE